jgi:hypothetical protein
MHLIVFTLRAIMHRSKGDLFLLRSLRGRQLRPLHRVFETS